MEPKLVVLKPDFFNVNEIYIDENDDENRINDLVEQGAFDDEINVYVHRTGLVNQNGAWNTLCFPFDLTKSDFQLLPSLKQIQMRQTIHGKERLTRMEIFFSPLSM